MIGTTNSGRWIHPRSAPGLILLAGFVFSFGPLVFRWKTDESTEWQFLFYRSLSIAIVMSVLLLGTDRRSATTRIRTGLPRAMLGGLLIAGMFTSFIVAIARIDAATTLLLQSLAPFSAAALGWLLLREGVDRHTVLAMFLAVAGVAIIGTTWDTSNTVGIAVACGIPLLLGIYTVLLRGEHAPDPIAQVIFAGGFGMAIALIATGGDVAVPARDVAMGAISGGMLLGLGFPVFNAAARFVPAARTSLLLLTEIVLAPIWVWLFVDEQPALNTVAGGVVVLFALVWLATHPSVEDTVVSEEPA